MIRSAAVVVAVMVAGCERGGSTPPPDEVSADGVCTRVGEGFGPRGETPLTVETIASGLSVPWGLAFLPDGDVLVTERPGRVRLIRDRRLVPEPVATIVVEDPGNEGGLLGIALHPDFPQVRDFFIYTAGRTNEVQRWTLAADGRSAQLARVILSGIPGADFHSGGRLKVGPDRLLYASTGDAKNAELAQDVTSLAGKLLRITPEGDIPADNPFEGRAAYVLGIRNSQGFDWAAPDVLYVTDHGPTGEFLRTGNDEISLAEPGANLGWPNIFGCQAAEGLVRPSIVWDSALPPGGAAFYGGDAIPEWKDAFLLTTLGAEHLHLVRFDPRDRARVASHESYLNREYGRLREVAVAPDGAVWVTTTNCDTYGRCPPEGDLILRITR